MTSQPDIVHDNLFLAAILQAKKASSHRKHALKVVLNHSAGGCGNMRSVQHTLSSMAPKVFTMQLAWQSANETKQDIAQTLGGLQEVCS